MGTISKTYNYRMNVDIISCFWSIISDITQTKGQNSIYIEIE